MSTPRALVLLALSCLASGGVAEAAPERPPITWRPAAWGNYRSADRTEITRIVIHKAEGNDASSWFQSPEAGTSAHYDVHHDGSIYQSVEDQDLAWHSGNGEYNATSIGIEHSGYIGRDDVTEAEYRASARLVAYLCARYGIPIDRRHIVGHDEVPDPNDPDASGGANHHTDPGRFWDWDHYMALVREASAPRPSVEDPAPQPTVESAPDGPIEEPTVATVKVGTLNVRSEPTTASEVLTKVHAGDVLPVEGREENGWLRVRLASGREAYVKSDFVALAPAPAPTVGSVSDGPAAEPAAELAPEATVATVEVPTLNVRSRPTTGSEALAKVHAGDVLAVEGRAENGWLRVRLASGRAGYVKGDFVALASAPAQTIASAPDGPAPASPTTAIVESHGLNVRAGPTSASEVLTEVNAGDVLSVEGRAENGWLRVRLASGLAGYVNGDFVRLAPAPVSDAASSRSGPTRGMVQALLSDRP